MSKYKVRDWESPPDSYDDETELCEHLLDEDTNECVNKCGLMTESEYERHCEDLTTDIAVSNYLENREASYNDY